MAKSIVTQVAELENMTTHELQQKWGTLYNSPPPIRISKQQIVGRLAYRLQELVYGGLPDDIRQQLENIGEFHSQKTVAEKSDKPVSGTRFIRDWNGKRYEVEVLDKGFAFNGKQYRSLTAIATEITGTKWNGHEFFGLRSKGDKK